MADAKLESLGDAIADSVSKPVPDLGPKPGEERMEVEIPAKLHTELRNYAARHYQCSLERITSAVMRVAFAGKDPRHKQNSKRDIRFFTAGRKYENALLEALNGSPVNLRAARVVAHKLNIDVNDLLREGLARVLAEYGEHESIRFGGRFQRMEGGRKK